MPLYYACNANVPEGEPITPIARKRVQAGKYFVPDCADYRSKFGLPPRVKLKAVYAGWSCYNCSHLLEAKEPFVGPQHSTFSAQRAGLMVGAQAAPPGGPVATGNAAPKAAAAESGTGASEA